MSLHKKHNAMATIALTPVDNPTIYGVVETNAESRVKRFIEKPSWDKVTTNMINAGIYILEPDILNYIASNVFFMFERDVFPPLLEKGQTICGYASEAYWIDMGTPEKYLRLHHDLLNHYEGAKFEGESVIHPSAQIEGPVLIGEGCFVDKDAVIRGPACLGQGCHIEEGATIEGAVLWQCCKVGRGVELRNCVIGCNCYIEEEGEILDNCVLGDNVRIGKGNKLSQGIRIWPNKSIEPNTSSF
jgi:mannose-1-phosphate guanylyltransferase